MGACRLLCGAPPLSLFGLVAGGKPEAASLCGVQRKKHLQIFLFIKKSCIFAVSMLIQKDKKMTAVQVNAQNIKLLQGIGAIADSEPLMNRLSKYVERLVREKNRATALTKEQFYDRIERAEAAYRRGECVEMPLNEDLSTFLKRTAYDL